MSSVTTINPATGQVLDVYPNWTPDNLERHLVLCTQEQQPWVDLPLARRSELLLRLAAILRDEKSSLALLATREMGKCMSEGEGEVEKCAWLCEYYAEEGAGLLAPETRASDAQLSQVVYRPLGAILGIMPWNFPFWQVFRFAVPTLLAGNTCLIKHAANVRGCAEAIEALFLDAGFPEFVYSHLPVDHDLIPGLIADPRIHGVSLTGSTRAGRIVAGLAGQALKPSLLELGGSDPYLVLDDADPETAADICVKSRMINNGQSCIAAKRFIVHHSLRKAFEEHCIEKMSAYSMGNPENPSTRLGPLARQDLRDALQHQVDHSISAGATVSLGGSIPDGEGFYYPPTLLCDAPSGSPARQEELFGPAASLIEVQNDAEAIAVANETAYGLGACVITGDATRGQGIAENHLQAGACFVNGFVRSDPRLPFGGIGESGYGRELGLEGARAFTNAKLVYVT